MEINGEPATPEQVRSAQTYGHFTSMQVRDGAVAGEAPRQAALARAERERVEGDEHRLLFREVVVVASWGNAAGR